MIETVKLRTNSCKRVYPVQHWDGSKYTYTVDIPSPIGRVMVSDWDHTAVDLFIIDDHFCVVELSPGGAGWLIWEVE